MVGCSAPENKPDEDQLETRRHDVTMEHNHDHDHQHSRGHHDHRFENPEDYVSRWNSPERDEWQRPDEVMRILDIQPGQTVADLGTGTGYFVPHLSQAVGANGKVLALDVEQNMVGFVQKTAAEQGLQNVEAIKIPYDSTNLEPGSLDRLLTVNTWHHIANREAYSAHLKSVLKPDGFIVLVDYTKEAPHGPPAKHRLAPEVVIRELEAGGLSARIVESELPVQYVIVATHK